MGFPTYPSKRTELYDTFLQEVAEAKLTMREVDILSCILHNRGAKKIASLLDIASRTVTTHISNIMNKLRSNSRDHIIDIIQKSGKMQHFRLYYFNLLTEATFVKALYLIGKYSNDIVYSIDFDSSEDVSHCAEKLSKYLAFANINPMTGHETHAKIYHVYFSTTNCIKILYKDNNIVLVVRDYDSHISEDDIKYIDFTPEGNLYLSVLRLAEQMVQRPELEKLIWDFQSEYQALQNAWDGGILVDAEISPILLEQQKLPILRVSIVVLCTILVISMVTIILRQWIVSGDSISTTQTEYELDPDIKAFLDIAQNHNFSANNIIKEQMHMNNDLINHIAQILEYLENPKIDTYLHNPNVSSIILLGLAHNLHALSNYYMYNDNDGEKAREILSYTKKLLEHYVNNYSSVALNFDKMSKEEIYTELSILQDLPEIYARVMYSLGRTYRYQGNEQDAVPHLKLSQYLGQKTGIFESYLSTLNIIDLTIGAEVDRAIKNGNHVLAQKKLIEIIDLYQALGQDETRYKLDYQPNTTKQDLIIPKADAYNLITLGERITKHYATLIVITNDPVKNTAYLKEITRQFLGDSNTPGILEISKHTSLRKASSSYNTLGNIIVKLYDASINSKSLQKALIEQLNLSRGDALDIAWQIFDLSHYLSRNTDITKADAYHGMIKVYKRKINNKTHNSEQQNIMNAKIAELTEKRDKINAVLKRMRN